MSVNGSLVQNLSRVQNPALDQLSFFVWFTVTQVACFAGAVLCLSLIVMLLRSQPLRSGPGTSMVGLLFFQFLFTGIICPIQMASIYVHMTTGAYLPLDCSVFSFFYYFTGTTYAWLEVALAVSRFVAIVIPVSYSQFMANTASLLISGAVILACFLMQVPYFMVAVSFEGDQRMPSGQCARAAGFGKAGMMTRDVLTAYLPAVLTPAVLFSIFCKVYASQKRNLELPTASMRRIQRRYAFARMLLANVAWSFMFNVPNMLQVVMVYPAWAHGTYYGLWAKTVSITGMATTPLVFVLVNAEYKLQAATCVQALRRRFFRYPCSSRGRRVDPVGGVDFRFAGLDSLSRNPSRSNCVDSNRYRMELRDNRNRH